MMNILCNDCPNKSLCSCLCPEAEMYVNQDNKEQRELLISNPKSGNWPDFIEKSKYTETERNILHALLDGKTRVEICQTLNITRESLRKHISNIRRKRG